MLPLHYSPDGSEELTPKLTPFFTPTAFSGCDQAATIGNRQSICQEGTLRGNCLGEQKLGNENDTLSANVIENNQARPAGLEPATFGFEVRRSIQLGYGRDLRQTVDTWLGSKKASDFPEALYQPEGTISLELPMVKEA